MYKPLLTILMLVTPPGFTQTLELEVINRAEKGVMLGSERVLSRGLA